MNEECATCSYLDICKITDAQKILSHYVCDSYTPVISLEVVKARMDILSKFGSAGMKVMVPSEEYKDE